MILWKNFIKCLFKYDVFHFYFGQTLLPDSIDLRILSFFNKVIVMTCCGSDYRLMEVERKRNPYIDIFLAENNINNAYLKDQRTKEILKYQARWIQCFFAPRNGYEHVATVVNPKQINTDLWIYNLACDSDNCIEPELVNTRDVPQIVHLPTKKNVKGSEYILKAINDLKNKGVEFNYREITGITHEEALNIIQESENVVDQMLLEESGRLSLSQ